MPLLIYVNFRQIIFVLKNTIILLIFIFVLINESYAQSGIANNKGEFLNSIGMKFIYIEPGSFTMEDIIKVNISKGFYLQDTEVTVAQWAIFINDTGYVTDAEKEEWAWVWEGVKFVKEKGKYWSKKYIDSLSLLRTPKSPVTCVSYNDIIAFIEWINAKEGRLYSLPTEAQWEYVCKAGSTNMYCFGDNEGDLKNFAWYIDTLPSIFESDSEFPKVATKNPTKWGIYDIQGSVREWCKDSCDWNQKNGIVTNTFIEEIENDPFCQQGKLRIIRGCSVFDVADYCRCSFRMAREPEYRDSALGFRLVLKKVEIDGKEDVHK